VSLLKGRSVPVDWAQLLRDLQEWEWESRSVQRAWARAFWQRPEREAEDHGGAMGEPGDEDRSAG
jgi:CRISPR system Cascade subunit CasB